MSDERCRKIHMTIEAWERAGLRGHPGLPEPDVVPRPGINGRVCYIGDISLVDRVLALLKEHAGDPEVDRAIWMIEAQFRGDKNHG